jgi:hypothetical protein
MLNATRSMLPALSTVALQSKNYPFDINIFTKENVSSVICMLETRSPLQINPDRIAHRLNWVNATVPAMKYPNHSFYFQSLPLQGR